MMGTSREWPISMTCSSGSAARALGSRREVVYGGRVGADGFVELVGGGAVVVADFDQSPARNRHAAVVLHAELALDDYLIGHSGGIWDALYLVIVVAGHAGGGGVRERGGAAGCNERGFDAEHTGDALSDRVYEFAEVHVVFLGGVHHLSDFGRGRSSAKQGAVALRVDYRTDTEFFKNRGHGARLLCISEWGYFSDRRGWGASGRPLWVIMGPRERISGEERTVCRTPTHT